jgi:hypothetical protein
MATFNVVATPVEVIYTLLRGFLLWTLWTQMRRMQSESRLEVQLPVHCYLTKQ